MSYLLNNPWMDLIELDILRLHTWNDAIYNIQYILRKDTKSIQTFEKRFRDNTINKRWNIKIKFR